MPRTTRQLVEEALTKQRANTLWTANYLPVLPITPQDFDIGALLPAMLYMARWGYRRGKGKFVETFGTLVKGQSQPPRIADVTAHLARSDALQGFDDSTGQTMLGDLLLACCLENKAHASGHLEQVQRAYPTHYMTSWLDLPRELNHLRGVPELLTTLLAGQEIGEWLESGKQNGPFSISVDFADNALLALFGRHLTICGPFDALNSDTFTEITANDIGIDELLAIRIAQACGSAPLKVRGGEESERIANRYPLARRATEALREDLSLFTAAYGATAPRQTFLQMLEAGVALGMTHLLLSTARLLAAWEISGQVPAWEQQTTLPLFVDCSHGQDRALRDLSESATAECIRRYERLPLSMMALRVLDDRARKDRLLREALPACIPDATEWINLLGEIVQEQHPRSRAILNALREDGLRLAQALKEDRDSSDTDIADRLLRNQGNPAWRLAEALCALMGDKLQRGRFMSALDSALMTDQPNGLAIKRRAQRTQGGVGRRVDLRAIVLTPPLLEFLVHRHLCQPTADAMPLSLPGFITLLRERYGLYIAQEPPGQPISQEMLLRNKVYLERRLRDMGLLIGVNDAETMKLLKPHYRREPRNAAG